MKVCTIFDVLERELGPIRLRDLTTEKLSYFQARLRGTGRAETTIAGYLAHLRAALRWAVDIGLIAVAPKIQRPKRAKSSKVMKGRPITEQEFQLMLEKTVTVVGPEAAASWRHYLRGLWWSGLRLAESMDLYWDDDTKLCVHFADGEVFIRVPAALEKGNKDRLLPVAPEFADFLSQTPRVERVGPVFNPKARRVCGPRLNIFRVSETVRDIGRAAGILVNRGGTKYASAHDLRRSFGERWSALIMPQVLMELMRHESIDTTLKYYVGQNAARTTKLLRAAFDKARSSGETPSEPSYGDTYGDTKGNSAACKQEPNPEKPSG